ncbi:MAG: hypothetical protein M9938_11510 [Solirubrobacterales bacterium]|nr:hypothetical protein [Solirubrobacterales bacterium]
MKDRPGPTADQVIGRILGPAGPEVSCDDCFRWLDHYVELERDGLDAEAAIPGMAAHLEGCPACKDDHAALHDWLGRAET